MSAPGTAAAAPADRAHTSSMSAPVSAAGAAGAGTRAAAGMPDLPDGDGEKLSTSELRRRRRARATEAASGVTSVGIGRGRRARAVVHAPDDGGDGDEEAVDEEAKHSKWSCLERRTLAVFKKAFTWQGRVNARHPWKVIIVTVVVSLALAGGGFARRGELTEKRSERLWAPQDSQAFAHADEASAAFGTPPRWARFVFRDGATPFGVLSPAAMRDISDLDSRVAALAVTVGGKKYQYGDVCHRAWRGTGAPCVSVSASDFSGRGQVGGAVPPADRAGVAAAFAPDVVATPQGLPVQRTWVLGGVRLSAGATPTPVVADAAMSSYMLSSEAADDAAVSAWALAFDALVEEQGRALRAARPEGSDVSEHPTLFHATFRSLDDEVAVAVAETTGLVAISAVLVAVYLASTLTEFDDRRRRSGLGAAGVFMILLGVGGGLGTAFLFGVLNTPITNIIIFVALGVGVDDIAVVVGLFDRTFKEDSIESRNESAMAAAGSAITATSFTTVVALAVGAASSFPSISNFSASSALVMGFLWVIMCTAFNAALVLDERRHKAGRRDMLCCCARADAAVRNLKEERVMFPPTSRWGRPVPDDIRALDPGDPSSGNSLAGEIAAFVFGYLLRQRWYRLGILTFFALLTAGAVLYSSFNLREGLRTQDTLSDDSFFAAFLDETQVSFAHLGAPVDFIIRAPDVIRDTQALATFSTEVGALRYVGDGTTRSVWPAFAAWRDSAAGTAALASANGTGARQLAAFLKLAPLYSPDVVFTADGSAVAVARIGARHIELPETPQRTAAMAEARAAAEKLGRSLAAGRGAFAFAEQYKLWDSYAVTAKELRDAMLGAIGAIAVVLGATQHPVAMTLAVFTVVAVDVLLVAWIPLLGLRLHSVTLVTLVMSVGLAVDFSVHVTHAFMEATGTRENRAVRAVATLASPMITGGTSTILGVLLLAYSPAQSSRIFLLMMCGTITAGSLYGMLLLPVLLIYLGPVDASVDGDELVGVRPKFVPGSHFRPRRRDMPPHPRFPWTNVVLRGGGMKGNAYTGVLKVLEEFGVARHMSRFAGTSIGAWFAMLFALGAHSDELIDMIRTHALDDLLNDRYAVAGFAVKARKLMQRLGMNSGWRLRRYARNTVSLYTGDPDLTFRGLYELRGVELCVAVTDINTSSAEYLHVKTAPDMRIVDGVMASLSIPLFLQPTWRSTDGGELGSLFVDGFVLCNYPIHAFDGWYLSMNPQDAFLNRVRPLSSIAEYYPESVRFGERNPATMGCTILHADEVDVTREWIRPGGGAPARPRTRLAAAMASREAAMGERARQREQLDSALERFLNAAHRADANGSGTLTPADVAAILAATSPADREELFGAADIDAERVVDVLDTDGDGEVSFEEVLQFMTAQNFDIASRFAGLGRKQVHTAGALLAGLIDATTAAVSRLHVKPEDRPRTIPIDCDYITPGDFDGSLEDLKFLVSTGVNATRAFIVEYCQEHGIVVQEALEEARAKRRALRNWDSIRSYSVSGGILKGSTPSSGSGWLPRAAAVAVVPEGVGDRSDDDSSDAEADAAVEAAAVLAAAKARAAPAGNSYVVDKAAVG